MDRVNLWGWDKGTRTMLRFIKVGDILCFKINESEEKYGYGILIAKLDGWFACRIYDIQHTNPNVVTTKEIMEAKQLGKIFILDVYSTLDNKKHIHKGEWRVLGHYDNFELTPDEIKNVFFEYGPSGMKRKIDLLGNDQEISDKEAERYLPYSPVTGDDAKRWYIKYE
ncbi:Imm26 family immunity protein [Neisseria bergeri]|uniref:Imm26 family immunity protein n=1 Tax=Neisseria bergeri TaxID=1906581 RepID=UPI0027DFD5FD|nr:Imm26 family immunity protein [Neisseria bergeri]